MLRFSKWSLCFKFSDYSFVYTSHLFHVCLHALPISSNLIFIALTIFGEKYKVWSSLVFNFLRPPVITVSWIQIFSLAPSSQTPLISVPHLGWETKYFSSLCVLHTLPISSPLISSSQ
jgi:hypothetical protein